MDISTLVRNDLPSVLTLVRENLRTRHLHDGICFGFYRGHRRQFALNC
ncbi:MAG: hypothetical protein ACI93T_001048 [Porticoccaceae bacterium]|jgi:hypothetical protein